MTAGSPTPFRALCAALAFSAAACGAAAPAPPVGEPEAYELVVLAELALEAGDAETAAKQFAAASAIDPDDAYLRQRYVEAVALASRRR